MYNDRKARASHVIEIETEPRDALGCISTMVILTATVLIVIALIIVL